MISIYIKDKTLMKIIKERLGKKMQMSGASQYGPKLWGYVSFSATLEEKHKWEPMSLHSCISRLSFEEK